MIVMTYRELIAWILVVLFAATSTLLFIFNPGSSEQSVVVEQPTDNTPSLEQPTSEPDVETAASCTDGKQNQDETDIDCGGSCKVCADGKECSVDSDCSSNDCSGGVCRATPQLSGKIDFVIKDAGYDTNANTAKLTELELTISNGESAPLDATVQIYAKSYNDIYYLNQINSGERDVNKPYASIDLPTIASGKSITQSFDVTAAWLGNWQDPDDTDILDEGFSVEVLLVDESGEILRTVKRAVRT